MAVSVFIDLIAASSPASAAAGERSRALHGDVLVPAAGALI